MSILVLNRISFKAPLTALLIAGTSACGNIWTTPEPVDYSAADEAPAATGDSDSLLSTTGASAAVGAVIGGTAGLIIGSSTGNAGEGVVLGSLTGAAVGGLIGNEIENTEEIDAEQDDVIRRHEEILKKQQRELDELKRMGGGDQMAFVPGHSSSLPQPPAPVLSTKQSSIKTQDLISKRDSKLPAARAEGATLPPAARARLKEGAEINAPEGTRVYLRPPSQPVESRTTRSLEQTPAPKQKVAMTAPKSKKVVEREIVSQPPKKTVAKAEVKAPAKTVAKTPVKPTLGNTIARPAPKAAAGGSKCMLAETEAERARNAASDADKLFYYRRAIQLCPSAAVYHIEIGRVYIDIGRQEDAEFEFRRALDLDPDNRQAQDQLTLLQAGE